MQTTSLQTLLSTLRLQRGWSQQQLADISGLNVRTIQRLESGHAASVESLKALAAALEVDWHTLQAHASVSAPAQAAGLPSAATEAEAPAARGHEKRQRRFVRHVWVFALVMAGLWWLNAQGQPGHWWAIWPTLGWGLPLLMRGLRWRQRSGLGSQP